MSAEPAPPKLAGIGDEAAFGITGQVAAIGELGWSAIELRTIDGIPLAELEAQQHSRVLSAVREARLEVVCLASRIGNWARPITAPFADDVCELDALADQCAAFDTRYVRIMSYPNDGLSDDEWGERARDRVALLAERAAQRGIVLLHENCAGWAGNDADRMLQLITDVDSPSLQLLFDTGNGVDHGYDAVDLLHRVLPHVAHVHVKDAVAARGHASYALPGEGQAQVPECLRLLLSKGYPGTLSIEPHLATRPHDGLYAKDSSTEPFVQAGRRLELLLSELATPTGPGGLTCSASIEARDGATA